MILELDCGNSLIKWRVVNNHDVIARGANRQLHPLLEDIANSQQVFNFCRLVSVRSEQETSQLINLLSTQYSVPIKQAVSCKESLGVKNGYKDHSRLGADRWAAIIAAYNKGKTATLTLGFGTAITSDFIDQDGQHLGGFIAPGLSLLRQQLLANTSRIHYHPDIAKDILSPIEQPASSTENAVNGGCHLMLQGFISQQLILAKHYFGNQFNIFTSGGDAIHFNIPDAHHEPDLVFNGLSLLCPAMDNA